MCRISGRLMRTAFLVGLLCTLVCCTKIGTRKSGVSADEFVANFRLSFAVPKDTKATYSADYSDPMNNEGTDNLLRADDLEIYFFNQNGTYVSCVKGILNLRLMEDGETSQSDRYHVYNAEMYVEGIVNGGVYRVVAVANRRSHLAGAFPFCTPLAEDWLENGIGQTDEEKLYSTLKFNFSSTGTAGVSGYVSRNFIWDETAYVPMWGFRQLTASTRNGKDFPDNLPVSGTIDLMRSIAKVKIEIDEALTQSAFLTEFNPLSSRGGIRLYCPVREGWMTPSYSRIEHLSQTPEILDKDREGGLPSGSFTDDWIHKGESADNSYIYPFYRHSDGCYYIYMPECSIGESWIGLEFQLVDEHISTDTTTGFVIRDFRLEFAEYKATDKASREDQIDRFPVMRNHYYSYKISRLDPLIVKYEVCDWNYKSTELEFN